MDLLHPGLVRTDTEAERQVAVGGRQLMSAYLALGCTATWTCAPYQLPDRPSLGEHIAWAESNAIVFANSVLGRTLLGSELAYPLLGHHVGTVARAETPVLVGIPADASEDKLKAFGAAAASSGGVAMRMRTAYLGEL